MERTAVDAEGAGATTSEEIVGLCEIVPRSQHPHPRISLSYQISIVTAASATTVEQHGDPRLKQLPMSMPALSGHGREFAITRLLPAPSTQRINSMSRSVSSTFTISIVGSASASSDQHQLLAKHPAPGAANHLIERNLASFEHGRECIGGRFQIGSTYLHGLNLSQDRLERILIFL